MADRDELDWIKENEPWRLEKKVEVKDNWYSKLVNIKGIGKEIANDLGRVYDSEEELVQSLKEDKVPIRNDKVNLLKEYYEVI